MMFWECMHTVLQPSLSVSRIASIGICSFVLLFEVDWVGWVVNNFTSIPAAASVVFIHWTTVSFDISLYGFDVIINSEAILPFLSFAALVFC